MKPQINQIAIKLIAENSIHRVSNHERLYIVCVLVNNGILIPTHSMLIR